MSYYSFINCSDLTRVHCSDWAGLPRRTSSADSLLESELSSAATIQSIGNRVCRNVVIVVLNFTYLDECSMMDKIGVFFQSQLHKGIPVAHSQIPLHRNEISLLLIEIPLGER